MATQDAIHKAEAAGKKLVEEWFDAYNSNDAAAHRKLVRFPLAGFGGARPGRDNLSVSIRHEAGNWGADTPGQGVLYRDENWSHSVLLRQEARHATEAKVHVLTDFTRNTADGEAYGVGLSRLTIGIRDEEGWWIRGLSSCGLRDPRDLSEGTDESVVSAARETVEAVVDACNAHDVAWLRQLCHYPFVRLAGTSFEVHEDPSDHEISVTDAWSRSEVRSIDIPRPQAGDKAVVDLVVDRYDESGKQLEPEGAICLVVRHGDRWGLQLCSTERGLTGLP